MGTLAHVDSYRAPDQIHWCTGHTPKRTSIVKGKKIVEKFPSAVYRTMIDRQGNRVAMILTNGAGTTAPSEAQITGRLAELERKGFFAAFECPIATRSKGFARKDTRITEPTRGEAPCASHVDPVTGDPKAVAGVMCKHVQAEAKARRKANTVADRKFRDQFKDAPRRMLELMLADKGIKIEDEDEDEDVTAAPSKEPGRAR